MQGASALLWRSRSKFLIPLFHALVMGGPVDFDFMMYQEPISHFGRILCYFSWNISSHESNHILLSHHFEHVELCRLLGVCPKLSASCIADCWEFVRNCPRLAFRICDFGPTSYLSCHNFQSSCTPAHATGALATLKDQDSW